MAMSDRLIAKEYRSQLESGPDDVELARLVFEDIRAGDGAALSNFALRSIFSTLASEGAMDECRQLVEYALRRGMHLDCDFPAFRTEQFTAVLHVHDAMRQEGREIHPSLSTTALLAATKLEQRGRVFELLEAQTLNPADGVDTSKVYGLVLAVACQTKQHGLVREILEYMHKTGVDDDGAYRSVMGSAVKLGEHEFVLELLDGLEMFGVDPMKGFEPYFLSLHKAGQYERLVGVFELARGVGRTLNDTMYGAVLRAAVETKKHDLAFEILDEIANKRDVVEISPHTLAKMMGAAMVTKQYQFALELCDHMRQFGDEAALVYTSAIRSAFKLNQFDFVLNMVYKMKTNGLDASGEYSHVIMSFYKAKRYHHLLRAFMAMREFGYDQEAVLHERALTAAIKTNQSDVVLDICKGNGNKSESERWYTYALQQARASNKEDLAGSLLDCIKHSTVDGLRQAHIKKGVYLRTSDFTNKREARDILERSRADNMHSAIDELPVDSTDEIDAMAELSLERKLRQADAFKNALLEAYAYQKDVTETLDHMLEALMDHSALFYLQVLRGADAAKQHELVVAITEHMSKNGVDLSAEMYEVVLGSCARVNDLEMALGFKYSMRRCDVAMTEQAAHCLVKCAAKVDEWSTVVDILTDLRRSGVTPTISTYTMALNECGKRHHFEAAVGIYGVMPAESRAQLKGTSFRRVILGHAKADSKELRLRGLEILDEHKREIAAKQYSDLRKKFLVQEDVPIVAKSLNGVKDNSSPTMGIMSYFSSLIQKIYP